MATPPSAPIITLAPRASTQTLEFRWSAPINLGSPSTITTYLLELYTSDGTPVQQQTVSGTTFYYRATGLTNGVVYITTIKASNDSGSTYGPAASFRPFSPGSSVPGAPATATATAGSDYTSAMVAWTPPSQLPDSTIFWYVIQSSSSDGSDPVLKFTADGLTQTNYEVNGLNSASTYTFRVRAVNCPGYSLPTITNSVGPPVPSFTPLSISNCEIWLDGLDPNNTGIQPSNGTNISTWVDKTGNGHSASGGPYSYQTNGLLITYFMNFATGVTFPSQHTSFLVAYPTASTQQYYNWVNGNPASSPAYIANYDGNKLEYFNGGDRATFDVNPTGVFLATYTYSSGVSVVGYYNSATSVFSISQTNGANTQPYSAIGSSQINARICEYIIYNRVLNSTELGQVTNYLKTKYSIP